MMKPLQKRFQSTLPVRGATTDIESTEAVPRISIHAPRAGSDHNVIRNAAFAFISIHAPRAGSDDALAAYLQEISFISIHAPRAGSDLDADSAIIRRWISIHAPRAGSDGKWLGGHIIFARFQSTLPVRGATVHRGKLGADPRISIHAPRAGSDHPQPMLPRWPPYFNPRSPCGERRAVRFAARLTDSFQSTLPVRGATRRPKRTYQRDETISIHAPRAGSDDQLIRLPHAHPYFNPRSPCGERLHG